MHRILVVEDHVEIADLYELALEEAGFEVRKATNGAQAMRICREWKPALVLLDIQLGDENGLDLLRHIIEHDRETRTVLVSAYPGYKDDFSSWLADAFVVKGGPISSLVGKAQELLAADADGRQSGKRWASQPATSAG